MNSKIRIRAFYPNFYEDKLIAYASLRIVKNWNDEQIRADIMGLSSDASMRTFKEPAHANDSTGESSRHRVYRDAIPSGVIWAIARRVLSLKQIQAIAELRFFFTMRKGDVAYLWPDASLSLYRRLKAAGFLIVSERINTLLANSKRILDAEYSRLGLQTIHGISDAAVDEEMACMNLSDFIFSPSPGVTRSLLDAGIPDEKVLQSSYGLEAHQIFPRPAVKPTDRTITAIFVGSICVRKGIHLLIKAWSRLSVKARLVVVGRISTDVEQLFKDALSKDDSMVHVDFVNDLEPIFRQADLLILPSLEEGSPLVSYLALGAWIPLIVSPMGAGGIVDEGVDGIIIDPYNVEEFTRAIESVVQNADLRTNLSISAGEKAPNYVWERVASRRKVSLLEKLMVIV